MIKINVYSKGNERRHDVVSSWSQIDDGMSKCKDENEAKRILLMELSLRKHTSSPDFKQNPALYKVNKVNVRDMKVNFALLPADDQVQRRDISGDDIVFPSEEEMLKVMKPCSEEEVPSTICLEDEFSSTNSHDAIDINEPVIVIWDTKGNRKWYVGFVRKHLRPDLYLVDHLECVSKKKGWKQYGDTLSVKTSRRSKQIK